MEEINQEIGTLLEDALRKLPPSPSENVLPLSRWMTFLDVIGARHCELYDEGWKRIGCIGCPMSSQRHKMEENERWPHVRRNWIKAIREIRKMGLGG